MPFCAFTRKKPLVADQVASTTTKRHSTRQRAMLDFAMKVCGHHHRGRTATLALHAHGFNDEDAWDIAAHHRVLWPEQPRRPASACNPTPVLSDGADAGKSKINSCFRLQIKMNAILKNRFNNHSGQCHDFLRGKFTQMVVAPPAAPTPCRGRLCGSGYTRFRTWCGWVADVHAGQHVSGCSSCL